MKCRIIGTVDATTLFQSKMFLSRPAAKRGYLEFLQKIQMNMAKGTYKNTMYDVDFYELGFSLVKADTQETICWLPEPEKRFKERMFDKKLRNYLAK